jgi:hypothetical protein
MADLSLKSRSHFQQMNSFADNTDPGLAEMLRKDWSVVLLQKLFFILPFLSPGESPQSFIETFNFGMALVNFRQKVKKDGWWKEKHAMLGIRF